MTIWLHLTRSDMSVSEHQQQAIRNSDKNQSLRDNNWLLTDNHYICELYSQMLLNTTKVIV